MQISTRAIVLYHTKYSDTAIIVNLYTEVLGRVAVMVYGISSKKKSSLSYFQPLYLLDVVLSHKANRQVNTLKEVKASPVLPNLSADFTKATQAIFLAEVLSKSLNNQEGDESLFLYLSSSIEMLDQMETAFHNFHLAFLIKLSKHLGFWLTNIDDSIGFYDFQTGQTLFEKPSHPFYISFPDLKRCTTFQTTPYNKLNEISITGHDRNRIIESIIKMYEFHITNFSKLKSYQILKEVFA